MKTIGPLTLAVVAVAAAATLGGCAGPSSTPTPQAAKPVVEIDPTWGSTNGEWTFTGRVDPRGAATDVVLEAGPGTSTGRRFDRQFAVAYGVVDPGPLTIATSDIADITQVCVRFTATNIAGTSWTAPLCFSHDMPSIVADDVPPTTDFSAPAFGTTTVLNAASYAVSWTETDTGSGVTRRSLQRRVASYAAGSCGTYADDGPTSTTASPVDASGLLDGKCYQWVLSLSDQAGNTSATTSGTVRVELGDHS
jgi:hypothetical protein